MTFERNIRWLRERKLPPLAWLDTLPAQAARFEARKLAMRLDICGSNIAGNEKPQRRFPPPTAPHAPNGKPAGSATRQHIDKGYKKCGKNS
jgi:hypothetical protein